MPRRGSLAQFERRTDHSHLVVSKQLGERVTLQRLRQRAQPLEEPLYRQRGIDADEDGPWLVAHARPRMCHVARRENDVSGTQPEYFSTDFHGELPLDGVEPLVLFQVDVTDRA